MSLFAVEANATRRTVKQMRFGPDGRQRRHTPIPRMAPWPGGSRPLIAHCFAKPERREAPFWTIVSIGRLGDAESRQGTTPDGPRRGTIASSDNVCSQGDEISIAIKDEGCSRRKGRSPKPVTASERPESRIAATTNRSYSSPNPVGTGASTRSIARPPSRPHRCDLSLLER